MATLSFHAPKQVEKKIRAAAKRRGVNVSQFLRDSAEHAAAESPVGGLGRELEKLAIDSLALIAAERIRARQKREWTGRELDAEVKAARRERRARP